MFWTVLLFQLSILIIPVHSFGKECNIKFCTSCDPKTNFCNECDLPYKPGYANQTICTRCSNNCGVCEKPGEDSKGRCLSCEANYNYASDDYCGTFYIWIYVVTSAAYVVFVIILFIVFCLIKRSKDRRQAMWFENLKTQYNKVENNVVPMMDFQKMCESLVDLLKESSSYNNLKFKDREYEKAIKIKEIMIKNVPKQTHMKKIQIIGSDNSEFTARGFIYVSQNSNNRLKMWLAKDYKRKVFSEQISKIIIYESEMIDMNEIKGRWYYYGAEEICGTWRGLRHQMRLEAVNNVNHA